MASRIEQFQCTIAAGTAIATPQTFPLTFNRGIVQKLEITVPPGPSGLVGFQITHSGSVIIPYNSATFIVTDNEHIEWDVENYPTGSAWGLRGYNLDVYAHSIFVRFLIRETGSTIVGQVPILDIQQIAPAEVEPIPEEVP